MKGPKGKDLTVFVRFGNLDHNKKQKRHFGNSDTYHTAPAKRGFYAMPKVRQEFFLISSLASTQKKGQFAKDGYNFNRGVYSNIRKEFKKSRGTIWHHLAEHCKVTDILDRNGSWVKTDMETWRKAFNKSCLTERYGDGVWGINSINSARGINGIYSGDHYEVFVDEKV